MYEKYIKMYKFLHGKILQFKGMLSCFSKLSCKTRDSVF